MMFAASHSWCVKFTNCYLKNCRELNIPLAEQCKKYEKAFLCSTCGKFLGVFFDTTTFSWKLPDEKKGKALDAIRTALSAKKVELLFMQQLMGSLNDFSLMCPFLNGFKRPLNDTLHLLRGGGGETALGQEAKRDLLVWAGFLTDEEKWNPICHIPSAPPPFKKEFTSDAAGAAKDSLDKVGCGNIGFYQDGLLFYATQIFWDAENFFL
jgi:hypothetical protein